MSAHAEHLDAVGVGELDRMVVIDLAILFAGAHLSSAHTFGLFWRATHQPVDDVDVVNVLFDDMVTAQPVEVIPVTHLVRQFGLAFLTIAYP